MFSWTSSDFHFLEPIQVNFQFLSSPPTSYPCCACWIQQGVVSQTIQKQLRWLRSTSSTAVTACSIYPAWKKQQSLKSAHPLQWVN